MMDIEKSIWDYLKAQGFTDAGCAAVLGNMHAESACKPDNLQNTGNARLGMTDEQYTAAVDNCTYTRFVNDSIGYGLCQWTYWSRKDALLRLAQKTKRSIGDYRVQLEYLITELRGYGLLSKIRDADDYDKAARIFMTQFERPANMTEANQRVRVGYAKTYFDRYAGDKLANDLAVLVAHGVISTPAYWQAKAPTVQYLPELIHNMAIALKE